MPVEIGLLSTQQDSFDHHEELSKLLNETDVFYVPLRGEFADNNQDLNELTKRFDEDLSNRHLIVTFRDIGYSLSLGSVEKLIDENDQTKIRVSGKNIVDGICIQFLGCFDYGKRVRQHSDASLQQQINGVGRVELDEQLYRELSSIQNANETEVKDDEEEAAAAAEGEEENKEEIIEPVIMHKTRQQTAKLKGRAETMIPITKKKTRPRTISENVLTKSSTTTGSGSSPPAALQTTGPLPPPPPLQMPAPRPRIHSPGHMPYPLRSPRLMGNANRQQHRGSSPLTVGSSPRTSEMQSSVELSQSAQPRLHVISHSPHYSSGNQTTMPIQIPTSPHIGPPPGSLPQMANFFPLPPSHSLPAYFLPSANIAYVTTGPPPTNATGTTFDFTSMAPNTGMFLITNTNQHPSQPLHIITSFEHHSLPFATTAQYAPNSFLTPSRTCNILHPVNTTIGESMSLPLQNKRHENAEDEEQQHQLQQPQQQQQVDSNKQQLPFKKRRYAGEQSSSRLHMTTVHNEDDADGDDIQEEPVRK